MAIQITHLCEWCRRPTHEDELAHIKAEDIYLCEVCEDLYLERLAQFYNRQIEDDVTWR